MSNTSPTATQRKLAWTIIIFLAVVMATVVPFFHVQLGALPAFVPVVHAIVFVTSLIAATFLFTQYAMEPQPALLALGGGYVLAGLFSFFQSLAFPHSYSATGLLGGPSVAGWLFLFWRTSFGLGVLTYILMQRSGRTRDAGGTVVVPIAVTIACVVAGAFCLTWLIVVAQPHLPPLFTDSLHESAVAPYTVIPAVLLSLAAISLLLTRPPTTLDLWLIVTLAAALPDIIVPVSRFMIGFYVARGYEVISSCAILSVLLTESSILYARLASARALQAHAQTERFSGVEAVTASLAHELRQPLTAIRTHAFAGATLLRDQDPDLQAVGEILHAIDSDACRARDVFDQIRAALRRQEPSLRAVDVNSIVSEVIELLSDDIAARQVTVVTGSSGARAHAICDRTQIVQVLLNLVTNGMDAMEALPVAQRRLTIGTSEHEGAVVISVSDCGRGISPENMARIFEPFFTTRNVGMGLGLSIVQSIVQAHKGRVWAENNAGGGATFYFKLPIAEAYEKAQM